MARSPTMRSLLLGRDGARARLRASPFQFARLRASCATKPDNVRANRLVARSRDGAAPTTGARSLHLQLAGGPHEPAR